ncbi:MAG: nuclear receptor-binding factor 2 [Bacteroidales bacterium]|nr:nuclear receptor-binding factor 2 [Bacteroidales bacterium]
MRFSFLWIAIAITLLLASCARNAVEICRTEYGRVVLIDGNDTTAAILHIAHNGDTLSDWRLYHSVYHCDYGDVNGDGLPEIAVGVTKKTRYWRTEDKRLFIFKLFDGQLIRPLWLGSRLGCPIVTFRIERDSTPARIVSTEQCGDSVAYVMYRIKGFGPKFECYVEE